MFGIDLYYNCLRIGYLSSIAYASKISGLCPKN